jgi:drug/metabolite transporter (DMT)-like permease
MFSENTGDFSRDKASALLDDESNKKRDEIEGEPNDDHNDALVELNQITFLASSNLSLKKKRKSIMRQVSHPNNEEPLLKPKDRSKLSVFVDKIPFKGFLLSVISAMFSGVSLVFLKGTKTMSASDNALIKYLMGFFIMLPIVRYKKLNMFGEKKDRKSLFSRSALGVVSMLTALFSIQFLQPSDAMSIFHSGIIFTAILSRIILKEKLSIVHIVAINFTLIGIVFIVKPTSIFGSNTKQNNSSLYNLNSTLSNNISDNLTMNYTDTNTESLKHMAVVFGVSLALVSALLGGFVRILVKKLVMQKLHFSLISIIAPYLGLPASLIISLILIISGVSHNNFRAELHLLPMDLFYAMMSGFAGVGAQTAFNLALKYEDTSKVAIFKTFDVLVSVLSQYLILGVTLDIFSIFGSFLIVAGTMLVIIFKVIEDTWKSNKKFENYRGFCFKCINLKF